MLDLVSLSEGSLNSDTTSPQPNFGRFHFAGQHFGEVSLSGNNPYLSRKGRQWIESRTGGIVSLPQELRGPPWQVRRGIDSPFLRDLGTLEMGTELPSRDVVEQCIRTFVLHPLGRIFPVVDVVLFRQTVELAYQSHPGPPVVESVGAQACVLAFMALMALHRLCPLSNPPIDCEKCALKAQLLLPKIIQETTIDVFQTHFMLVCRPPLSLLCADAAFGPNLGPLYFRQADARLSGIIPGAILPFPWPATKVIRLPLCVL